MCVRFLSSVLAVIVLSSTAARASDQPDQGQAPDCSGPLTGQVNTRRLNVQEYQEFPVGGDGWMRTHITSDGRAVVATVDNFQRLQVYDLKTREPVSLATRQDFNGKFTRGEWAVYEGRSVVILGDIYGRLHFFSIGPDPEYFSVYTGESTPVYPYALTADGDIYVGMPNIGRVRIMPAPPRLTHHMRTDVTEIVTSSRFMRAAHFRPSGRRDLIATISQGTLQVFDREADPSHAPWGRDLMSDGRDASVTWFPNAETEANLVIADGDKLTVHFPFAPQRQKVETFIAGSANGRVHALTTPAGLTFIEAPGTEGSNIYQYKDGHLALFTRLDSNVAPGQKSIFLAPNGRVYVLWVEEIDGHGRRRLNISKVQRNTSEPTFQYELERDEFVHDAQAMNLGASDQQLMTIKTSQRTKTFKIEPAPAN